jgi:L-asparagine transporter-like permease
MKRNPDFKADLAVFALIIFLLGVVFSMFVLEKDPDARLGLFGVSVWILVIVGALYFRIKSSREEKNGD